MISELDLISNWFAFSATLGGALWGVSLQPDFKSITMRAKAWRFFLSVLAAIFTGPYILHRFFESTHPSAAAFCLFLMAAVALAVGPVVIRRITQWSRQVRISFGGNNDAD